MEAMSQNIRSLHLASYVNRRVRYRLVYLGQTGEIHPRGIQQAMGTVFARGNCRNTRNAFQLSPRGWMLNLAVSHSSRNHISGQGGLTSFETAV